MVTTAMTIHPTYDPTARVWFVEGYPQEAKTIRDLLSKFPKGCKVQDYYPRGFAMNWTDKPYASALTREAPKINIPRPPPLKPFKPAIVVAKETVDPLDKWPSIPPAERHRQYPSWSPEQYEQALDMWAEGINGKEIGEKIGLPRVVVSSRMMEVARARKDPRAVSRRRPYAKSIIDASFPSYPKPEHKDRGTS